MQVRLLHSMRALCQQRSSPQYAQLACSPNAGNEVVIEEFLEGEEASFFALVDGTTCVALASAQVEFCWRGSMANAPAAPAGIARQIAEPVSAVQDHKAAGDGDTGPNTGGMGAYSPAPVITPEIEAQVMHDIVQRTADAMADRGNPFSGILFAGLMIKGGKARLCLLLLVLALTCVHTLR